MTTAEVVTWLWGLAGTLVSGGIIYLCKTFGPIPHTVLSLIDSVNSIRDLVSTQNEMLVRHKIETATQRQDIDQLKKNDGEIISEIHSLDKGLQDVRERVIKIETTLDIAEQ